MEKNIPLYWKTISKTGFKQLHLVRTQRAFQGSTSQIWGQSFETCAVGCSDEMEFVKSINWYPVCNSAWTSSADSCGMTSRSAEGCKLHSCSVYNWVKNYSFPFIVGLIMISIITCNIKLFCFIYNNKILGFIYCLMK